MTYVYKYRTNDGANASYHSDSAATVNEAWNELEKIFNERLESVMSIKTGENITGRNHENQKTNGS